MEMNRFFTLETEARNQFYQVPKVFMLEESKYFKMSAMTKLLYGVLADRNSLSIKNGWVDDDKRVFFLFCQEEIGKLLGIKDTKTVRKYLKELESLDLLYRKRQGLNKTDKFYLLQVEVYESQSYQLIGKNSRSAKGNIPLLNKEISPANNTNINNTESINNKKNREGEPFFPVLSEEIEVIFSDDEKREAPPIVPEECINDLDKYVAGRFKKERQLYGFNFNKGQYYLAFADAVIKTQLQDGIEIITMNQYPYFIATLKKMIEHLETERKLLK